MNNISFPKALNRNWWTISPSRKAFPAKKAVKEDWWTIFPSKKALKGDWWTILPSKKKGFPSKFPSRKAFPSNEALKENWGTIFPSKKALKGDWWTILPSKKASKGYWWTIFSSKKSFSQRLLVNNIFACIVPLPMPGCMDGCTDEVNDKSTMRSFRLTTTPARCSIVTQGALTLGRHQSRLQECSAAALPYCLGKMMSFNPLLCP